MSRVIGEFEQYVLQGYSNNPEMFELLAIVFSASFIIMFAMSLLAFMRSRGKLCAFSAVTAFFSFYFAIFFAHPRLGIAITVCITGFLIMCTFFAILVKLSFKHSGY